VRLGVALAIANLAALAAFGLLALHAARLSGSGESASEGGPSLRALAAFPFAFFLGAAYSDSLFLALAAAALLLAHRRWWAAAAACAVLAGLCRPAAAVLVLPLAWEAFTAGGPRAMRTARSLLAGAAAPIGIGIYSAYLWVRFGDPLLFTHTQQQYWHHRFMPPWEVAPLIASHLVAGRAGLMPLELLLMAGFIALLVLGWRWLPPSHVLLVAGVIALILIAPNPDQNDVIASTGRYLLAAFPGFLVLGRLMAARPWLDLVMTATGFMLQSGLLLVFLTGGPVL
jgi:hypothetical protein